VDCAAALHQVLPLKNRFRVGEDKITGNKKARMSGLFCGEK
jgi:hypothetical protein